jgi:hypothetical protein
LERRCCCACGGEVSVIDKNRFLDEEDKSKIDLGELISLWKINQPIEFDGKEGSFKKACVQVMLQDNWYSTMKNDEQKELLQLISAAVEDKLNVVSLD